MLVATAMHGAMNAFGLVAASIPPAEALWFVLASASLVIGVLLVIDWRMWFARPAETKVNEAVPSVT
ncbi:MAG: hypothetical protein M5R40_12205 [Anaerolineae bacterium]|nr:hypothetical protein [Anaerolineae bacterium]